MTVFFFRWVFGVLAFTARSSRVCRAFLWRSLRVLLRTPEYYVRILRAVRHLTLHVSIKAPTLIFLTMYKG